MRALRRHKGQTAIAPTTGSREWVEIRTWTAPSGWIPRDVLEGMGIDCSPLDRRDSYGRQGTIWFKKEQSEAISRHPEWDPVREEGADP